MINMKRIYIINLTVILITAFLFTGCCFAPIDVPGKFLSLLDTFKENKEEMPEDQPEPDHGIFSGNPQNHKISSITVPGQAIDVDISGNYAYLTNDLAYYI